MRVVNAGRNSTLRDLSTMSAGNGGASAPPSGLDQAIDPSSARASSSQHQGLEEVEESAIPNSQSTAASSHAGILSLSYEDSLIHGPTYSPENFFEALSDMPFPAESDDQYDDQDDAAAAIAYGPQGPEEHVEDHVGEGIAQETDATTALSSLDQMPPYDPAGNEVFAFVASAAYAHDEYTIPTDLDVLCGRGGKPHMGNQRYLHEKAKYHHEYASASKKGKGTIAKKVHDAVLGWKGRFLQKDASIPGAANWKVLHWEAPEDKIVIHNKITQALRETKTPGGTHTTKRAPPEEPIPPQKRRSLRPPPDSSQEGNVE